MYVDFTEIFCHVDDFFKENTKNIAAINSCNAKPGRKRNLNNSEVLTILIGYFQSSCDCFKNYYLKQICIYYKKDFNLVSYSRFVNLIGEHLADIMLLLNYILSPCDGISFVDSTPLEVCKNYRVYSHRVFKGLAAKSKTSKGHFYGLKLHVIVNTKGELVKLCFTAGNKDDRKGLKNMVNGICGKVFGDKGYISKALFEELFSSGIQLITGLKKNMKNKLMPIMDKAILLKRILIETVFSQVKLLGKFEHGRHRSPTNAFVHMIAGLVNYQLKKDKPSIDSLLKIC